MRIAALYDIHGNLPALEAVLSEVRAARPDLLVVGGDVLPGPMPTECLAMLRAVELPVRFIHGNGDREVLLERAGTPSAGIPPAFREVMTWNAARLTTDDAAFVSAWPATIREQVDGLGDVLFCHATPRSDTEIFTRLTPEDRLRPAFDGIDAAVVVCGHTHMPFDRRIGSIRVINAGSIGMPFGEPGADWLLLGPDVRPIHSEYDRHAAAARIRRSAYPQAEQFAESNVLHPPTAEDMLAVFTNASPT
jgi:putative phosphoesterase